MVSFTVQIGEQDPAWAGWRWECEAVDSDRPPAPGQPWVSSRTSTTEWLVITRVRAVCRDLEPYFEAIWGSDGKTDGAKLYGPIDHLNTAGWRRLGRGRTLVIGAVQRIGRPRQDETWARDFADKWRDYVDRNKGRRPKRREMADEMAHDFDYFKKRYRDVIGVAWSKYEPPRLLHPLFRTSPVRHEQE